MCVCIPWRYVYYKLALVYIWLINYIIGEQMRDVCQNATIHSLTTPLSEYILNIKPSMCKKNVLFYCKVGFIEGLNCRVGLKLTLVLLVVKRDCYWRGMFVYRTSVTGNIV